MPLSSRKSQRRCCARRSGGVAHAAAVVSRKKQRMSTRRRRSSNVNRARRFRHRRRSRGGGFPVQMEGIYIHELTEDEDIHTWCQSNGLILDSSKPQHSSQGTNLESRGLSTYLSANIHSYLSGGVYNVIIGNSHTAQSLEPNFKTYFSIKMNSLNRKIGTQSGVLIAPNLVNYMKLLLDASRTIPESRIDTAQEDFQCLAPLSDFLAHRGNEPEDNALIKQNETALPELQRSLCAFLTQFGKGFHKVDESLFTKDTRDILVPCNLNESGSSLTSFNITDNSICVTLPFLDPSNLIRETPVNFTDTPLSEKQLNDWREKRAVTVKESYLEALRYVLQSKPQSDPLMAYYTFTRENEPTPISVNIFTKFENFRYVPSYARTVVSVTIQNISLFNIHSASLLFATLFKDTV